MLGVTLLIIPKIYLAPVTDCLPQPTTEYSNIFLQLCDLVWHT